MKKTISKLAGVAMTAVLALSIMSCKQPQSNGDGNSDGKADSKEMVSVKGITINGDESWEPASKVFIEGRSLVIPDLLVCNHEVTRAEFKDVMGIDPSKVKAFDKDGVELTGDEALNNPVTNVNWYQAVVYCNKLSAKENLTPCYSLNGKTDADKWGTIPTSNSLTWNGIKCDWEANGYRLPTEAEWEWLARGGQNFNYAGSNEYDEVAWFNENTEDKKDPKNVVDTGTREVKTKEKNGYGLYDMSGNVMEWCWDWYITKIKTDTPFSGPTYIQSRVLRGGSWSDKSTGQKITNRTGDYPAWPDNKYGFRVCRYIKE